MNNKVIELAKKLNELAKRGIGGEKITAEKMLQDLMRKHSLTITDIEGEAVDIHFFNLKEDEHKLWHQIVGHTNEAIACFGEFPKSKVRQLGLSGNYAVKCTVAEYLEIEAKNDFYQRLYKEELAIFQYGFIMSNDLFAGNADPERKYSEKELQEIKRAMAMSENIKRGQFLKQIKN